MRRRTVLGLEILSERITPTTLVVRNGVLIVNGSSWSDTIQVSCQDGMIHASVNQRELTAPASWIRRVAIHAGDSADFVFVDASVTVPSTIRGGYGWDHIQGGSGDDLIIGGPGLDTLYGGAGDDRVFGRGHADELYGGPGRDLLDGGRNCYPYWRDTIHAGPGDTIVREQSRYVPDVILSDEMDTDGGGGNGGIVAPYDGEPDDITGEALYRGEYVRLERIDLGGSSGIFYRLYLNGVLQDPTERRANGHIRVEVPVLSQFQIDAQLRSELEMNGWLTVVVIPR